MKRKLLLMCIAAALVMTTVVSGSLAAISASGAKATNELAAQVLKVNLTNTYTIDAGQLMPGDIINNKSTDFTVKNTAETPSYIRVTVRKYWLENINEDWQKDTDMDAKLLSMTAPSSGWLTAIGGMAFTSGETDVFYYYEPLNSGETVKLPLELMINQNVDNTYQNTRIQLDVSVDAVQFVMGENNLNAGGILSTFGVVATLDTAGNISSLAQ